jgi:hypothetical protein
MPCGGPSGQAEPWRPAAAAVRVQPGYKETGNHLPGDSQRSYGSYGTGIRPVYLGNAGLNPLHASKVAPRWEWEDATVRMSITGFLVAALFLVALSANRVNATSLTGQLGQLNSTAARRAAGTSAVVDTITPLLADLTARGVDFPVASTSAGYVFTYNAALGVFERSTSLGPALVERADTSGQGRFNLGLSYLYANITQVEGQSISGVQRPLAIFSNTGCCGQIGTKQTYTGFSLHENFWSFNATYGILENWDVNVLLPVVWTQLGAAGSVLQGKSIGTATLPTSNKGGIGDILLRTKYRFDVGWPVDVATMFTLRLPTGSKANFQGVGATTVTPWFIASKVLSEGDLHLNLGFEANANDVDASLFRYAVGGSWQPNLGSWGQHFAVLADVIGNSGIMATSAVQSAHVGATSVAQVASTMQQDGITFNSVTKSGNVAKVELPIARVDIVNLAFGFKFDLGEYALAYAEVLLPMNNGGVRADFAPTAGVQVGF